MLSKHDDPRSQRGSPVTRYSEQLDKLSKDILASVGFTLELNSYVCVVGVSGSLQIGEPEALEGSEGLFNLAMFDVPSNNCRVSALPLLSSHI